MSREVPTPEHQNSEEVAAKQETQATAATPTGGAAEENPSSSESPATDAPEADSLEAELAALVEEDQAKTAQAEQTQLQEHVAQLEEELARRNADLYNFEQQHNNYVKRSKQELAQQRQLAAQDVVEALLPVLDEIDLARKHGDLESGPFKVIAEKIESILAQNYQLERYGESGEKFDPTVHEALIAVSDPDVVEPMIKEIVQPGYRLGDRVVRAARVMVANPESE